jgi:uncharacterized protein YuzE
VSKWGKWTLLKIYHELKMKIKYDKETDILMIILRETFPVNAISEPGGVIISYDETDEPISLEFLNASQRNIIDPEEIALTIYQ